MIKWRKAPAGYIAQFFTDDKRPYEGVPNQDYREHHFLGVTGHWCPTKEEAIESVKQERLKVIKKERKKLEALEEKVRRQIKFIVTLEMVEVDIVQEKV